LALIGREDIPVFEGLSRPIVRPDFPEPRVSMRNPKVHLAELPFPATSTAKQALSAPEALTKLFREAPGEMALVAVGPLSNLAAAIALDPQFPSHASELIIMGGTIAKSNVTPSAEFNIWADPEAAAVVLAANFPKITLVPLDATHQALVSEADCDALRDLNNAGGRGAAELIGFRISGYEANQPTGVARTAPVHDAVCIAALVDPSLISTIFANVVVETRGEYTIGRTVVDHEHRTKRAPNCHVALSADRARFFEFIKATLSLSP
jgi:inosine-uridine nucleoside N-ribohydrolase